MSIEVKQLVVKAEVHAPSEQVASDRSLSVDLEAFRESILEECRRMLELLLEQQRER